MSSSYTLQFSDPTKSNTITVLGTTLGSGVNTTSTSLTLIGPGYINYGAASAQNFLKILENSASLHPPANAIEGQLWYDTSNPAKKVLRINNGTSNSSRWPSANGIYQQSTDPSIAYTHSTVDGDIWVDTANNQLKIKNGNTWTLVGPNTSSGSDKTGNETVLLESNTGVFFPVILSWANGHVVEITSYNSFIPRIIIDGFGEISAGLNLTSRVSAKYNGVASSASSLKYSNGLLLNAEDILKNNATSQTFVGEFIVESDSGFQVNNSTYNQSVNIYNAVAGGIIESSDPLSILQLGVKNKSYLKINGQYNNIGINTATIATSPTLDVYGSGRYLNTLTITTPAATALSVAGGGSFGGRLLVGGNLTTNGTTTATGSVTVGSTISGSGAIINPARHDVYDIGTLTGAFRDIYVSNVYATNVHGTVYGKSTGLQDSRYFKLQGQVTATTVMFNGDADVVFTATITPSIISAQLPTSTTTATQTLLILNTSTGIATPILEKISKVDFLSDVYAAIFKPGMIMPIGTSTAYTGFLACDGASYFAVDYAALYNIITTSYGSPEAGKFRVPNMQSITTATGGYPVYYQIKT